MAQLVRSQSVALVIGAGGPTGGPFSWSALEAITERTGWDPASATELIGTSAGAFVASRFEARAEIDPQAIESLRALANGHLFRATPALRLLGTLRRIGGRLVARLSPMSRGPAEYSVAEPPYHPGASAITVRRNNAKREHHRFVEAGGHRQVEAIVRASSAIPFVNKPVEIRGSRHVDGAAFSANNADVVSGAPDVVVILSPMVPASDGSLISRAHRAQLICEIADLVKRGCDVVAVLPSVETHATRRDRERFAPEGAAAVGRL